MCVDDLPTCISVQPVDIWCLWTQEKALDPLEQELLTIVSHYMGVGN